MLWLAKLASWVGTGIWKVLKALWNLLWTEKTPLLVTVGLTVAAAYLSPMITERFERQKLRSEYVLANLRDLNGLMAEIYVEVTNINYEVASGKPVPKENVKKAREIIAKINWKLVETAAMLKDEKDRRTVMRFQQRILELNRMLDGKLDVAGCRALLAKLGEAALEAALVIQAVGGRVELSDSDR